MEKYEKDSRLYRAIDGQYYKTMEEVQAINNSYWKFKNPMIIDKDSELFRAPLSPEIYDRIVSSPNYRCLLDILEEKLREQQVSETESRGMKR